MAKSKKPSGNVVKNTTKNRCAKPKKAREVKRIPNPQGLNQMTYKSARDAMHIYCENHPEMVIAGVDSIMKGVAEGNPEMIKIWISIFGGVDKQELELSGGVEISGLNISFDSYKEAKNGQDS